MPTKTPDSREPETPVEREIDALQVIVAEFHKLDAGAKQRVFGYLKSRFNLYVSSND